MDMSYYSVRWKDDYLSMLDQTLLPREEKYLRLTDYCDVIEAIRKLCVRGAPAIGVAAAYAVVLASRQAGNIIDLLRALDEIENARPTAVNLRWAVDRMRRVFDGKEVHLPGDLFESLLLEAHSICDEDVIMCEQMGKHGNELIKNGTRILTHCNTGALAAAGMGTALAPIFVAHKAGKNLTVYSDETRPLLQGARLTMWELMKEGLDCRLLCDSAAAWLMSRGGVDIIIVGADRIARNGDVANKIGTLSVANNARRYGIKFYVAAPSSTYDPMTPTGDNIEIEERDADELTLIGKTRVAPDGARVFAPAFDVTPAELIAGVVTEKGVHRPDELVDVFA